MIKKIIIILSIVLLFTVVFLNYKEFGNYEPLIFSEINKDPFSRSIIINIINPYQNFYCKDSEGLKHNISNYANYEKNNGIRIDVSNMNISELYIMYDNNVLKGCSVNFKDIRW